MTNKLKLNINTIKSSNIIKTSCEENNLDSSTRLIRQAAQKRGIKYTGIAFYEEKGLLHQIYSLNYGQKTHMLDITRPDITSSIANTITINKQLTKVFLKQNDLPCIKSEIFNNKTDANKYFKKLNQACVVKPLDGMGGVGVTVNIKTTQDLNKAITEAQNYCDNFLIEKMLEGDDYRCLCIGGKVVSISRRIPPSVIGDNKHTIKDLIEEINSTRSDQRTGMLSRIPLDQPLIHHLNAQNLSLESILPNNKKIYVRKNANLNTGGYSINFPVNKLHIKTKETIEKAAKLAGLQVTGVDILCNNLSEELSENNGNIIEMNARPRFRMHEAPHEGKPIKVSEYLIDLLFPETKIERKSLKTDTSECQT